MKTGDKVVLRIVLGCVMLIVTGLATAQIYKTIDKNGTAVYSDKPPSKDAKPVKLRPISVVEAPAYDLPPLTSGADASQGGNNKAPSLRSLRSNYKDFSIVAPKQEESVWHPEGPVTAAWHSRYQLQPGMQVTLTLDGDPQPPTTVQISPLDDLVRGEHTLEAVLKDAKNRTIATAAPVTFYIRQPNLNSNHAIAPGGGG